MSTWGQINCRGDWCSAHLFSYWSKEVKKAARPTGPEMATKRKEAAVVLSKWKVEKAGNKAGGGDDPPFKQVKSARGKFTEEKKRKVETSL